MGLGIEGVCNFALSVGRGSFLPSLRRQLSWPLPIYPGVDPANKKQKPAPLSAEAKCWVPRGKVPSTFLAVSDKQWVVQSF